MLFTSLPKFEYLKSSLVFCSSQLSTSSSKSLNVSCTHLLFFQAIISSLIDCCNRLLTSLSLKPYPYWKISHQTWNNLASLTVQLLCLSGKQKITLLRLKTLRSPWIIMSLKLRLPSLPLILCPLSTLFISLLQYLCINYIVITYLHVYFYNKHLANCLPTVLFLKSCLPPSLLKYPSILIPNPMLATIHIVSYVKNSCRHVFTPWLWHPVLLDWASDPSKVSLSPPSEFGIKDESELG